MTTEYKIRPRIPLATYRLQLNHRCTFRDAVRLVDYLDDLGITDLYASPYFRAKAGSLHGYDIVDHNTLNPEIGTEDDYRALIAALAVRDMGQVLDIVPNHMCVESPENGWWRDVLENGPSSPQAAAFDIDWSPVKKELKDKVLIPVLGGQYGDVLDAQDLALVYADGAFSVRYFDHSFPLRPATYALVLEHRLALLQETLPPDDPELAEYLSIITALAHLPPYTETDPAQVDERLREKEVIKRRLAGLVQASSAVREHLEENVRLYNGQKGDPRSFGLFDELLKQQIFRLAHWRVATEEINYRRFFDVNGLGAVRMEHADVFRATHALLFRLIADGSVTGLRVDHPDGLYNPVEYFHRLQRGCFVRCARGTGQAEPSPEEERELAERYDALVLADPAYKPFYIVGEKILTKSERMPEDWPIFSTTGYVFLNSVNGIFVDGANSRAFELLYERFVKEKHNLPEIVIEKKKLVMQVSMSSEVNTLGHYLNTLSETDRHTRDFTLNSLRSAITEVIACFPVYRTYTNSWSVADRDRQVIELAVAKAQRRNPALSASIFEYLKDVLLLRFPPDCRDEDKGAWLDFVMRFQQITGPVMAKGVEDTAFYVYNRLVSLNEVGGMPERFGTSLETFHGQNIERIKNWPHAMIATATHDTKRGEDVRARINVLSEIPKEWAERARTWARLNRRKKKTVDGSLVPDRNEEYLLYQNLVGAWPRQDAEQGEFAQRVQDYLLKAARESKVNTSWISPNGKYEDALLAFVRAVLADKRFLADFQPFQEMIAHYGEFNSLSQVLLKITAPGVPDFYQGSELWDLSLVDPDNRRPVDFDARIASLARLREREAATTAVDLAWELSQNRGNGAIKQYVIAKALRFRRENRALFEAGDYTPLVAEGPHAEQTVSFARIKNGSAALVVVPRFLTRLISGAGALPFGKAVWEETVLVLTHDAPGDRYRNVFTGEILTPQEEAGWRTIPLGDVFACFPVALLEGIG